MNQMITLPSFDLLLFFFFITYVCKQPNENPTSHISIIKRRTGLTSYVSHIISYRNSESFRDFKSYRFDKHSKYSN